MKKKEPGPCFCNACIVRLSRLSHRRVALSAVHETAMACRKCRHRKYLWLTKAETLAGEDIVLEEFEHQGLACRRIMAGVQGPMRACKCVCTTLRVVR